METTYKIALGFLKEGCLTDRKRKTLDYFGIPYPPKKIQGKKKLGDLLIWTKRKRESLGLPKEIDNTGGNGVNFVREIIRIRDNHICQKCKKMWISGNRRFDVHHLDGEMESTQNIKYDKENMDRLVTLCHKCHLNLHSIRRKMSQGRK